MVVIHIPRACRSVTVDFVKYFFQCYGKVESVIQSDNEFNENEFHIKIKDWTTIGETQVLFPLIQNGTVRICYDDTSGSRPWYFACFLVD